ISTFPLPDAVRICYRHLPYRFEAGLNGLPMIDAAAGLLKPVLMAAYIFKPLAPGSGESRSGEWDGGVITVPA
ncbi:hypothetical protein, partial [Salmonella enterica]|uniref:hypothetical protein n=1 Tax=Salmonella enterica TaxID=28901 RepID=UPI001CB88416